MEIVRLVVASPGDVKEERDKVNAVAEELIAIARKRVVEQTRDVLYPIGLCPFQMIRLWEYFDSDIGKDSAREVREFHIPDFSNWKDEDSYRLAFDRLLSDLRESLSPFLHDSTTGEGRSSSRARTESHLPAG